MPTDDNLPTIPVEVVRLILEHRRKRLAAEAKAKEEKKEPLDDENESEDKTE